MCAIGKIYLYIENVLSFKPCIICQVVLFVAYPGWCENFSHLTATLLLHFTTFDCARFDNISMLASDRTDSNLIVALIPKS